MKRRAMLVLAALLAGCGPKFKAGDCVASNLPRERWEDPPRIKMILEVGIENYRTEDRWDLGFWEEKFYSAVPCEVSR